MHIIPERPPELRSAPPLDFRIVWIFWVDFVCILITVHTYVKKKKKCWWTHKFTRLFSKRKKKISVFLFWLTWIFTVSLSLLAKNSKPAFSASALRSCKALPNVCIYCLYLCAYFMKHYVWQLSHVSFLLLSFSNNWEYDPPMYTVNWDCSKHMFM